MATHNIVEYDIAYLYHTTYWKISQGNAKAYNIESGRSRPWVLEMKIGEFSQDLDHLKNFASNLCNDYNPLGFPAVLLRYTTRRPLKLVQWNDKPYAIEHLTKIIDTTRDIKVDGCCYRDFYDNIEFYLTNPRECVHPNFRQLPYIFGKVETEEIPSVPEDDIRVLHKSSIILGRPSQPVDKPLELLVRNNTIKIGVISYTRMTTRLLDKYLKCDDLTDLVHEYLYID